MTAKNKMIILRGLPGSGKTTLAKFLSEENYAEHVHAAAFSADDYFYKNGVYTFDPEKLGGAHKHCQMMTELFMAEAPKYRATKKVAIVHTTSTTEKELSTYLDLAKKYDYEVVSLIVENRHGNESVHGVPEEAMKKMRDRFSVKL
jgi:predicted kinase